MRVGIYTRWQRRDSTYAAIQIADLLSRWQHDVTILTPTPTKPAVSSFWDRRVRHDTQVKFTEWTAPLAVVIWMFCPHAGQVTWARKAGKQTILVPDWADLHAIEQYGCLFDWIMAPTRHWVLTLEDSSPRNVIFCPWSPVLPVTERSLTNPIRVYVPPIDRPGDEDDSVAADVVEAMLSLDLQAQATVSMDGRRGAVVKRLERLARSERRLTLDRPADYQQQVLSYGEHSLTLLSAVVENFGMSALCSFHMGTPVVGFNISALDEVANSRNSILVDCQATDFPPVWPLPPTSEERRGLLDALMALVAGSGLSQLFTGCQTGLVRRRFAFSTAWAGALSHPTGRR